MMGRTAANWLLFATASIILLGAWWSAPTVRADSISLDQEATKIIARLPQGVSVDSTTWAAVWWSEPDRPACADGVFADQAGEAYPDFQEVSAVGAELEIPLAVSNQFVCFRVADPAGGWFYSDWLAVRVQVAELAVSQRHRFVTVTASRAVVEDSWRGLISAVDCPASEAIDQPLSSDLVRLGSDFQLVLEVPESANGQWLCVTAVDRNWSAPAASRHRLSRLTEEPPAVTISQVGNRLRATAVVDWPQSDWYFFKSFNQPNCRANPIPESGRVTDPLFDEWSTGQESTVQVVGDEPVWVCFMVFSPSDEFGNQVVGYGLYQVVSEPATNFRGLIWLVALNIFIVCIGSAIGILLYRNHPE